MREPRSENRGRAPWHVPLALEGVPETGQHLDLVANAEARAGVARIAGLRDLPRLQASFEVTRHGSRLRVQGRVSATVGQTCVVTLEPLTNEVEEAIDLAFAPPSAIKRDGEAAGAEARNPAESWNQPEPLIGGTVDLGALATEFLILGLDPYPRKPGAVFQPPSDASSDEGPFAALAELKRGRHGH
jgi:Large ribosomal RNA subunit accumulation protein YceD